MHRFVEHQAFARVLEHYYILLFKLSSNIRRVDLDRRFDFQAQFNYTISIVRSPLLFEMF